MAEEERTPELSLLLPDPDGLPIVFPIPEGTTTLGSARDNDLVLTDPSVKPHQVVLMREGDDLILQDLFAGETKVNGELCRKGSLRAGDTLHLGDFKMRIMRIAAGGSTARLSRTRGSTRRLRMGKVGGGDVGTASTTRPASARTSAPAKAGLPVAAGPPSREQRVLEEESRLARERDARRARALAKARQLGDELMSQDDFEVILERIAVSFLDVFTADRAVTLLFEEDGRNPLLTIERRRDGTDEGTGVAQEIIDRCLQVRSVVRVAGGMEGMGGLAAPLVVRGRALGLLYFERSLGNPHQLDADDVHLMAMLTNLASLLIAPLVD